MGLQTADAIVAERAKGGNLKDWNDLVKRVKGVGPKNSALMSQGGLPVNGQAKPSAPAKLLAKSLQKSTTAATDKLSKDDKPLAINNIDESKK